LSFREASKFVGSISSRTWLPVLAPWLDTSIARANDRLNGSVVLVISGIIEL